MMPSETRIISSIFSTPSVFSIFAMMRILRQLLFSSSLRMRTMSSAQRVNEAAMKSTSSLTPNARSALSFSLMYGIESVTPGTLMPLYDEIGPPFKTRHSTSVSVTCSTIISIRPSSMRMCTPGATSCGSFLKVTEQPSRSPGRSSVESVYFCPYSSTTGVSNAPVRISGPLVSSRMATGTSSSSRSFFTMSARRLCSSCLPCDMLRRATFMPLRISLRRMASSSVAGPSVHTIFVFLIIRAPRVIFLHPSQTAQSLVIYVYYTGKTPKNQAARAALRIIFAKALGADAEHAARGPLRFGRFGPAAQEALLNFAQE